MGRYRKISILIWNDQKFRALSDDGKLAFLFLLTHPHMTSLGAMRATTEGLAAELKWKHGRLREALKKAIGKGMLELDSEADCVFLPRFLKHNPPESPNVIKAWKSAYDEIPECRLKSQAIQASKAVAMGMSEAFRKAYESLPEAFHKDFANQEQEQEQEQEQDKTLSSELPDESSREFQLAALLSDLIRQNDPKARKPNFKKWAADIDKLIRLDGREPPQVEAVIKWCQRDSFWKGNILSAGKLRDKYPQLLHKMNGGNGHGKPEPERFSEKRYEGSDLDRIPWNQGGDV